MTLSVGYSRNIWPEVSQHGWKYRRRDQPPRLIELHATRSGIPGRSANDERLATEHWSLSAHNKVVEDSGYEWGSMENVIVGGGKATLVLPDEYWPHYSLGHADPIALSIEIGQNLEATPFEVRDLDLAARQCAVWCRTYDIPPRILHYLSADNREAPGLVRHDRSANGDAWGKSDPGRLFDDREFEERIAAYLEPEAPPEEEGEMKWWIVKRRNDHKSYLTNLLWRRHLVSKEDRETTAALLGINKEPYEWDDWYIDAIPEIS